MLSERNLGFFLSLDRLGGPITSAPAEELFADVRGVEAEKGFTDYGCVYFANLDPSPDGLMDPEAFLVVKPGTQSSVSLGIDPAGKNGEAQNVASRMDPPDGVVFVHSSQQVPFRLPGGAYLQNDRIALWIRREVPKGANVAEEGFKLMIRGESF